MESNKIEALLEKYDHAETTLAEERELKRYFAEADVPAHLDVYKPMFAYFKANEEEVFTKKLPLKTEQKYVLKWISAAAAVVLLLGFYFSRSNESQDLGTFDDPELAYLEVTKSLEMISEKLNQGTATVGYLDEVNKGTATLNYLNELENATQIIFKKQKQ
ncbi:hypothetical protein Q4566_07500 [Tamlana sp. 2_MG-2023]|uniref:hypothetical protein n=1 Tax=unclassified Tamlana TaxID=2614803 RepID=UPI0026E2C013|nr:MULTISPECIES: hypothetical protein [unclassified Tamlana]MDO6760041.1 hypothetical protein [Tamlana sp. 2_MG-2023]MDO6790261.1 hypothetical protein [Tamlana sp. 1_MG-2023]